ncbi:MAG TPA: response regulator, partial [Candidatus Hydrogenedentes bacterium]|nr:response regulator [Candidatus Hydrogenedentota bacterium]
CAAKDASGQLWFGSHSVGLQRYNGDCFQRLTSEDGLPSNSVTGLVPQTDGSMIIGTYRGIIRYRPRATRPARIEIRAAVADREYPHPTDLELITTQAHLVTISYHGVSLATRQMRYRYILEGYDTQWQDTWQNWVRYSNLPVGDYTFRVIAINRDLVPSTRPASMTLRILPDPKEQLLAEQEAEIGRMTKEIRLHQREERQNKVLVQLARSKTLYGGNLDAAFEEITETAAHTLEVDRVSIWLFNQEGDLLECLKRYERALNAHFDGGAFEAASYPAYMSALEHERILAIDNVNADLRVGPFADSVLFYPGAISVLDAPIRMEGKTTGIVQHVSASKPRTWDRADKDFAASVVGFVALAIEAHELERAEEERRHMESQVQHAQKLESLGVLAGGIAHDFNNLLVAILGNSDLMLKELAQDSPLRQFLEQIQSAALRGSELTNQMLAYSGKGPFALQVVDISRMVEEMSHLLRISISKKVELRCEFASGLSPIEVDPGQLRQVTMNLITNASEAIGDQNGVVRVRTGSIQADRAYLSGTGLGDNLPEGEYVYLEVVDTGCGMSAQTRTRIFDPFFTTKFAWRGLGLAAVLGIIRAHRGTIEIKTKPGAGTTFRVLFPSSSQAPTRPPALPGDRWNAIKGTVLVVDDEEVVRQVARKALERAGLTVLTANDGLEAVERFKNDAERISAVLLDMTMPRMDGKETFQELRRIRPDVPVILSSGYTEQHATERFAEEPRLSFIQKPYLTAVLLDKVSAALNG